MKKTIKKLKEKYGSWLEIPIILIALIIVTFFFGLCFYVVGKFIEAVEKFVIENQVPIIIVIAGFVLIYFVREHQKEK